MDGIIEQLARAEAFPTGTDLHCLDNPDKSCRAFSIRCGNMPRIPNCTTTLYDDRAQVLFFVVHFPGEGGADTRSQPPKNQPREA